MANFMQIHVYGVLPRKRNQSTLRHRFNEIPANEILDLLALKASKFNFLEYTIIEISFQQVKGTKTRFLVRALVAHLKTFSSSFNVTRKRAMIIFGNVVYNITYLYFSLNRRCITLLKTKQILITRQARFHKSIFFLETTVNFFLLGKKNRSQARFGASD